MNAGMMTIECMFAGSTNTHLEPTKLPALQRNKQNSQTTFEQTAHNKIHKQTPENTIINTQDEASVKPFHSLKPAVAQKPNTGKPKKSDLGNESIKKNPTPGADLQPVVIKQWLAQYSQNIEKGKMGTAKVGGPKADDKIVRLSVDLKDEKLTDAGSSLKAAESKTLPVVRTNVPELKTTVPNTSKQSITTDVQLDKLKNAEGVQISNKALYTAEDTTNQQSSKIIKSKAFADAGNKVTPANDKAAILQTVDASDGQKISKLNIDSLLAQSNNPQLQQKTILNSEKLSYVAEKQTADAASVFKKNHPDVNKFSELSVSDSKKQKQNLLNNSTIQKMDVTESLVSNGQRKNNNNSTSDTISNSIFGRLLPSNDTQATTANETLKFTEAPNTSNNTFPRDIVDGISRQISESIQQNSLNSEAGKQQITVRLHPPELGKVYIKFQEQENQLIGILEVEKAQTRNEIEQALPQIIRNLGDSGIQIKRIEVLQTDQTEQQFVKDQSMLNDSFHQQEFRWSDNQHNQNDYGANEWLASDSNYKNNPEAQVQFTDGSINMLI